MFLHCLALSPVSAVGTLALNTTHYKSCSALIALVPLSKSLFIDSAFIETLNAHLNGISTIITFVFICKLDRTVLILWMEQMNCNHFLKDDLELITCSSFVEDCYYTDQLLYRYRARLFSDKMMINCCFYLTLTAELLVIDLLIKESKYVITFLCAANSDCILVLYCTVFTLICVWSAELLSEGIL